MTLHLSRRALVAGALVAAAVPSITLAAADIVVAGEPLHDFAEFWSRLPLPFTPAEAWRRLPAKVQEEIGAAVIGMHLAEYIAGDEMAEADQFHDERLRIEAADVQGALLNSICPRLWALFPSVFGPDGDHPRWALDGGLAR